MAEKDTKDVEEKQAKKVVEKIKDRLIEEELKDSYIDYSMSVIVSRALPDVRDGLKPVHRRILFSMHELGLAHSKSFKKSARIVGEAMGKYHPHGDAAVYDSLVRMAQPFSLRHPLIQGQGNFGSLDGDRAAAMRYTEARLSKIAEEMLVDIEKETVKFVPNFDESLQEPSVLPSRFPNLLVNGSSGIAVGMATNLPPHNLGEVLDGVVAYIDNPDISIQELSQFVLAPDFPTGGLILGKAGIKSAFGIGKGHITLRARTSIEEKNGRKSIIVSEIPYQVNKSLLVEEIANLVKSKRVQGISDLRDESDKDGLRVVVELKRDVNDAVVLNQLFKHSRLQITFAANMLALVNNEPKVLNLKELIVNFVDHRRDVIRKRIAFDLKKAGEKAHLMEGLVIALDNLDECIKLIKGSKSAAIAKEGLVKTFSLTEVQAQAVLDMRLQKLTSLEQGKIKEEHKRLRVLIEELKLILASEKKILDLVKDDCVEIKEKYDNPRRTEIVDVGEDESDLQIEDLIEEEDVVVTVSHAGYVKRIGLDAYKSQRRGGKGVRAAATREDDWVEHLFIANTHSYLMVFTDKGKVYWLKVFQVPEAGRTAKGKALVNLIPLEKDEKVNAFVPVKEFDADHFLVMATKNGVIKKTNLSAYAKPRASGIIAINLDEGDSLINVVRTDGHKTLMLASENGNAVRFPESNVRPVGRASRGVRGINLVNDAVVGMVIAPEDGTLFTVTENGYGKRTKISDYRFTNRGGKGVINIQCSERNGRVVAVKAVKDVDELMLMSQSGIAIRSPASGISVIGRNTQGVRVMKLSVDDKVVAAAKIINEEEVPEEVVEDSE